MQMIKAEVVEVSGFKPAILGARLSYKSKHSADKSDSRMCCGRDDKCYSCTEQKDADGQCKLPMIGNFVVGSADLDLMERLNKADGDSHSKYLRMIHAYLLIEAPLYWWKESATYKVSTTENSTSTMHTITKDPIEITDFSNDKALMLGARHYNDWIADLNLLRDIYNDWENRGKAFEKKGISREDIWKALIQMLPDSYNQTRMCDWNYQVLAHMYHDRKNHKLTEWREFCEFIKTLPYSQLITG